MDDMCMCVSCSSNCRKKSSNKLLSQVYDNETENTTDVLSVGTPHHQTENDSGCTIGIPWYYECRMIDMVLIEYQKNIVMTHFDYRGSPPRAIQMIGVKWGGVVDDIQSNHHSTKVDSEITNEHIPTNYRYTHVHMQINK
jgi:hypothetical protein